MTRIGCEIMKDKAFLISHGVNVEKSLELFGDIETYNDMIQTFVKEVPEKMRKLKSYKEISDMANYAILAHSLKSDARYFGFENLGELAYQHELKGKENDMYYVTSHFDEFIGEIEKAIRIAKEYLGIEDGADTLESAKDFDSLNVKDKTILVVDDSDIVRNFIQKIFDDTYEVLIANDGNEALSIVLENIDNHRIVGMLLDLNMPNVDGFEVLEQFQKQNLFSKIPVSIITGEASKEMIEKAFTYPIVDILNKPFNERDVKRIVERTILFQETM